MKPKVGVIARCRAPSGAGFYYGRTDLADWLSAAPRRYFLSRTRTNATRQNRFCVGRGQPAPSISSARRQMQSIDKRISQEGSFPSEPEKAVKKPAPSPRWHPRPASWRKAQAARN